MDDAWWGPTTVVPGETRARMLVIEKGLPGSIFVKLRLLVLLGCRLSLGLFLQDDSLLPLPKTKNS